MLLLKAINGQELVLSDKNVVSAGTTDLEAQFDVGSLFVGDLIAYFNVVGREEAPYAITVTDGKCLVPWEVLATSCADYMPSSEKLPANINHMMLVSIADMERTTSSACRIPVYKSAFAEDTEEPSKPSETANEQAIKKTPTKGSVSNGTMTFGNDYNDNLFGVDVSGLGSSSLPTVTTIDASAWDTGTLSVTYSDGTTDALSVTFDDNGVPTSVGGVTLIFPEVS